VAFRNEPAVGKENQRGSDAVREIQSLRQQVQRLRIYLGASFAIVGIGTLVSIALMGFYGMRLGSRLTGLERRMDEVDEAASGRQEEMRRELVAQGAEIVAIRKSATDDLQAMREAQRKLAAVRDPSKDLAALRDANEALWTELANQKAELLESLRDPKPDAPLGASAPPRPRFRLGESAYVDPEEDPDRIKGFIPNGEAIHRANNLPANPALIVLEVSPVEVKLGERYRLEVRVVNQSNRPLTARTLRLDWSFRGGNTGGDVPLTETRIDAQRTTVVYRLEGQWSDAPNASPASVTATLTLADGARIRNRLEW
jgi:hypothetical protein